MRYANKGAVLLKAWRKKHGKTQADAAKLIGVHQTTFGEWEAGKEPLLRYALKLRSLAKVPVDAWYEPVESESGTDVNAAMVKAS